MLIPSGCPAAVACMSGGSTAPELSGFVKFYPANGGVLVFANLSGLPQNEGPGIFALHIHQGGDCSGDGFPNTDGHYNPSGAPHPRHAGDLPPLFRCGGRAVLAVLTDRFQIADILGRTVVIHSGPDDFTSQPAGNSGTKIACGVIRPV